MSTLKDASKEQRADREFVLDAVANDGYALEHASDELKADREVVLAVVINYGYALQYASDELRADREVVLTAVAQAGYARKYGKRLRALEYASEELRADRYIVNFAKSTRPQRMWKLVTVRFFANLFVKKLQRRVKEHERAYKRQRRR